ncbi:MAG TPA: MFS transporter, partial [Candidatus Eisenbacteria bacterium]|nr:MFS transporter [Candidatus Eisenbacteria bacterium]
PADAPPVAAGAPAGAPAARVPLRHVAAVFVGNGLEFYDFLTFSYFAVYISRTFYPPGNPSVALLATLATFGAGFLTRPVGAIVIGRMGDSLGRKPAMVFSFTLMGAAIVGLALTPPYTRIGAAAPVVVLLFRFVQGFALGGEVGPTTAYMAEAAPPHRRGLYLSMQYATQDGAVLVAGLVGTALAATLSAQQLQDWGWRAAMLLGASIVPFGIWLRRSLPETLERAGAAPEQPAPPGPQPAPAPRLARIAALGLMMLTAGTIGSYTLSYMTTYALDTLHLPATISFSLIIINGGVAMSFEALSGWLSDRFGRKPVMIVPGILLLASILPCFWVINHWRSTAALYGAEATLSLFAAISSVPVIVTITETLPARIRSGAVATIYAFAISIFGGSTQFVIQLLIHRTHDPLAPAYYWSAAAVVGLVAMALVPESAPVRRRPTTSRAATGA